MGLLLRLVGFITELAVVHQMLEHVGEPTTAPVIAQARSPLLEMKIAQQMDAPEVVLAAMFKLEFDQVENMTAAAEHDLAVHGAGSSAEPMLELEFEQTLGW